MTKTTYLETLRIHFERLFTLSERYLMIITLFRESEPDLILDECIRLQQLKPQHITDELLKKRTEFDKVLINLHIINDHFKTIQTIYRDLQIMTEGYKDELKEALGEDLPF